MNEISRRFPKDDGLKKEIAVGYSQIGGATNDLEEAAHYFEMSIAMRENLLKTSPDNLLVRRGLMVAYGNYAVVLGIPWTANLGRFDDAREYCRKAVAIAHEQVKADPENLNARFDLGASLSRLGAIPPAAGGVQASLYALNEAAGVLEALLKANPKGIRFALQFGEALEFAGHRYETLGDTAAAEQHYRRAIAIIDATPGASADLSSQVEAIASEEALAQLYDASRRTAEALDSATRAVARAEKWKAKGAEDAVAGNLGRAYLVLASIRRDAGDPQSAAQAAALAVSQLRTLSSPRLIAFYRDTLAEAEALINH